MESVAHDLRFALRVLWKRRATSALAVATIALGIGAAAATFSVVDGIILRPLPYREPERLVNLWRTFPDWRTDPALARGWDRIGFGFPELLDFRSAQHAFAELGAWNTTAAILTGAGVPEQVTITRASASLLPMLGVRAAFGRVFLPGEEGPGAPAVALVSHEAWRARFGGDPAAVGRVITLDSTRYTIVGVLPPGFRLVGERAAAPAVFWVPAGASGWDMLRNNRNFDLIGRLAPDVTPEAARLELERFLQATWTHTEPTGARLADTRAEVTAPVRGPVLLVFAAAALLLALACSNIATLLLGEAARRETEIATRAALGATSGRIARQLVTEHLLLAAAGAALGLVVAWAAVRTLVALAPPGMPRLDEVGVHLGTLGFATAAAVATALLFGLAPMLSLLRTRPDSLARAAGARTTARRGGLERAGLAVQLALSTVLIVGAALLGRSLQRLDAVDLGFEPEGLLFVRPSLPAARYPTPEARTALVRRAAERVRAMPGVRAASVGTGIPFGDGPSGTSIEAERGGGARFAADAQFRSFAPGLVATLGMHVVAGRDISEGDAATAPKVVLVNETMARRFWPTEPALGRRILVDREWREVVGVVRDTKHRRVDADADATFYMPVAQSQRVWSPSLVVRTAGDPAELAKAVEAQIRELDGAIAIPTVQPLAALVRRSLADYRFRAQVVAFFALVAAALGAVGVYGVTAGAVSRRVREMGIRMALGATPAGVVALVVRGAATLALLGALAGTLAALVAGRALRPFLFGVAPTDAPTYAAVLAVLLGTALLASLIPARRAARVEPGVVLREG